MVDPRCDAVWDEERPLSGAFWKRLEGGRGQKTGRSNGAEPRSIKDGHARGAGVFLVVASCCFFFSWLGSSLSVLPSWSCEGQLVETRTGGAAVPAVGWTRASERGVPERVRRPREESGPGATTPEGLEERSPSGTTRSGKSPPFLWGLCK